jgi:hypothetical protein
MADFSPLIQMSWLGQVSGVAYEIDRFAETQPTSQFFTRKITGLGRNSGFVEELDRCGRCFQPKSLGIIGFLRRCMGIAINS